MEVQTKHHVQKIRWPEKTFLTKRSTITFDKLTSFFTKAYGEIYGSIQNQGLRSTEPPCGIYYQVDEDQHLIDIAAAVAVRGPLEDDDQFQVLTIPQCDALQISCFGTYENMKPAYEALEKYATDQRLETLLIIEQYYSDPGIERDPAKWRTDIYFIVE